MQCKINILSKFQYKYKINVLSKYKYKINVLLKYKCKINIFNLMRMQNIFTSSSKWIFFLNLFKQPINKNVYDTKLR